MAPTLPPKNVIADGLKCVKSDNQEVTIRQKHEQNDRPWRTLGFPRPDATKLHLVKRRSNLQNENPRERLQKSAKG
jgi:hypothetical protein